MKQLLWYQLSSSSSLRPFALPMWFHHIILCLAANLIISCRARIGYPVCIKAANNLDLLKNCAGGHAVPAFRRPFSRRLLPYCPPSTADFNYIFSFQTHRIIYLPIQSNIINNGIQNDPSSSSSLAFRRLWQISHAHHPQAGHHVIATSRNPSKAPGHPKGNRRSRRDMASVRHEIQAREYPDSSR